MRVPETDIPSVVWRIADSVRLKNGLLTYGYEQQLAIDLARHIPQQPLLVLDGWQFKWGGRHETTLLLNALSIRCIYHLIAVHFGATRKRLRGMGASSICLVVPVQALVSELELMSSLPQSVIGEFVRYLTYGRDTRTPDPALQPLISLRPDTLAVPCIHYLSSNQERNLLSLQAQVQPVQFDALSGLFEKTMSATLATALQERWSLLRCNLTLTVAGVSEEIDLLVCDNEGRTLLACELRWMLGPGDPREVQNRKRVCLEKVNQLERKLCWLKRHTVDIARLAFPTAADINSGQSWNVVGIVVIENFGGTRSLNPDIPVMPSGLFKFGMRHAGSLLQFATWSRSLIWLPQEGAAFPSSNRGGAAGWDDVEVSRRKSSSLAARVPRVRIRNPSARLARGGCPRRFKNCNAAAHQYRRHPSA